MAKDVYDCCWPPCGRAFYRTAWDRVWRPLSAHDYCEKISGFMTWYRATGYRATDRRWATSAPPKTGMKKDVCSRHTYVLDNVGGVSLFPIGVFETLS